MGTGKKRHLLNLADKNGFLKMLAVDQRPPIFEIIKNLTNKKPKFQDIYSIKKMIIENLGHKSSAVLVDPVYCFPNLLQKIHNKGLIVTLESHDFIAKKNGRLSKNINNWNVGKIKRIGGDAVKVLVWYRHDANKNILKKQKEYVEKIGLECKKFDIPFLLEILTYELNDKKIRYEEDLNKRSDIVLNSLELFNQKKYNVDIFKLECPIPSNQIKNNNSFLLNKEFNKVKKITSKPWVMLSSGMSKDKFYLCLKHAYQNGCSGYLAGRSIWKEAFKKQIYGKKPIEYLNNEGLCYMDKINKLTNKHACSIKKMINFNNAKIKNFYITYKGFN